MAKYFIKENLEITVFWLLIALHLYPLLAIDFLQTLDGPAHLHNAILVKSMMGNSTAIGWSFFDPNYFPEPNWFSHIFLGIGTVFFSPAVAEKILQILCAGMIAPAFVILLKTLDFKFVFAFYIIPFIYVFPFFLGFYNFCVGLSFALLAFAQLVKYYKNPGSRSLLLLVVLILLTYFSHILTVLFLISLSGLLLAAKIFYPTKREEKKRLPIATIKRITLAYTPVIVLLIVYIFIRSGSGDIYFRSKLGLLNWIWQCRPIGALDLAFEVKYTSIVGVFILISVIAIVVLHFVTRSRIQQISLIFISAAAIYLLAFIIFPDSMATGGFINIRLLLFFYISLLLFIAANPIHGLWTYTGALLLCMVSFILLNYHFEKLNAISYQGKYFIEASKAIESNSVLLPLNYSENWLQSNLSNYLGTKNDVIILDNYEADKKPFPLKWKSVLNPYRLMGNFAGHPPLCPNIKNYETLSEHRIDYVSVWKYKLEYDDSCSTAVQNWLGSSFKIVHQSKDDFLTIYKRK